MGNVGKSWENHGKIMEIPYKQKFMAGNIIELNG
jgi:hypothetical protein